VPLSGNWAPSWRSPTRIVDAALRARSEIEYASPDPIYTEGSYEGTGQDLVRDHVLEVAAGIAAQHGSEAFHPFHDIATLAVSIGRHGDYRRHRDDAPPPRAA
jgi:hypothetical protein